MKREKKTLHFMLEHVNESSSANACHINSRVKDGWGKEGYNFSTKVLAKKNLWNDHRFLPVSFYKH